jgi:cation:H+ antiporter
MIAVMVACLPIFLSGYRIARWGRTVPAYYVFYVTYLILAATEHDVLPAFSRVMLLFVLPLTAVTLGVVAYGSVRAGR